MEEVRVRFAPSPTGPLHIGGARSALFNWLFARHNKGKLIVRVEDTDVERSSRESEEQILESLKWLGLDWDEGAEVGGDYGPYRQMDRLDIYKPFIQQLFDSGFVYNCYCTGEELEEEREKLREKGETPLYIGRCRNLTLEEEEKLIQSGRKPVVRFKVNSGDTLVIDDMVRGKVSFETAGIGDFIILKSDGVPVYNFAVVVDDNEMRITHVVRAEEHLSNTPRQLLLYKALGFKEPRFAHVSLILGEDRTKMSKRHGATSVVQYREKGYLPEALCNFLALLGWSPEGEEEIFDMESLVQRFTIDRVAKNPAVFNLEKLNWMNAHYLKKLSPEKLTKLALPFLEKAGYIADVEDIDMTWLQEVVVSLQEKIEYMEQIGKQAEAYFAKEIILEDDARVILEQEGSKEVAANFFAMIEKLETWEEGEIKKGIKQIGKDLKIKGKGLFMPIRVAVSGKTWGPDLPTLIRLLGKKELLNRQKQLNL